MLYVSGEVRSHHSPLHINHFLCKKPAVLFLHTNKVKFLDTAICPLWSVASSSLAEGISFLFKKTSRIVSSPFFPPRGQVKFLDMAICPPPGTLVSAILTRRAALQAV